MSFDLNEFAERSHRIAPPAPKIQQQLARKFWISGTPWPANAMSFHVCNRSLVDYGNAEASVVKGD